MKNKKYFVYAFLLSFAIGIMSILPNILEGKGILNLWGDFNSQQITFGMYINDAIKNGNVNWNWTNHLGNSFLMSFSFYLLGSPFYLITLLFSAEIYPYLIGPILILKYGIAGLTSYAYIQSFVKNKRYALLASMLYSFSGFQITNMMFNHFHDVVALFPLLLLSLDKLMIEKKRGLFVLVLALLAIVNYFFFVGECVFILIYIICNFITKRYQLNKNNIKNLVIEGIIGLLISCVLAFPSFLNILNNPRVDVGWNFVSALKYLFSNYILIIKSFILSPDLMNASSVLRPFNFLSTEQYLPFVGIVLTVPYIIKNKKSMISLVIFACLIFMFIPILNSAFVGFTSQYYSRWFYMPILFYCICSAKTLDENYSWKSGFITTIIVACIYLILLLLYKIFTESAVVMSLGYLIFNSIITLISLLIMFIIYKIKFKDKYLLLIVFIFFVSVILTDNNISQSVSNITSPYSSYSYQEYYRNYYLNINNNIELDNNTNYRLENKCDNNLNMLLEIPSLSSFISTANGNFYEFYNTINNKDYNIAAPNYDVSQYSLKTFLSNKYILICNSDETTNITKDLLEYKSKVDSFYDYYYDKRIDTTKYNIYDNTEKEVLEYKDLYDIYYKDKIYTIYENKEFLSFGLLYDNYINQKDFDKLNIEEKSNAYLKGVILNDKQKNKYKNILTNLDRDDLYKISYEDYINDYNKFKDNGYVKFEINNSGFNASVNSSRDNLIVFTTPYDKGWRAYVNGKEVDIEKVSKGFMAVRINKGDNRVEFKFKTYGQDVGILLSIIGIILYIIYIIRLRLCKK